MSTNAEDQARQGFESGRSDYQVNYPFVYPSAAGDERGVPEEHGLGALPAHATRTRRAGRRWAGSTSACRSTRETPDLAFEAAECIANEQHQGDAAELGGLPPTTEAVYETEQVKKAYPFADLLRESIEAAAPRPVTPAYSDISLAIQKTYSPPDGVDPNGIVEKLRDRIEKRGRREDLLMEAAQPPRRPPRRRRRQEEDHRPRAGRAQARLAAVRAGGDRDADRDRLPDRLRDLPVAAELRPALPRRQGVRRPLELRATCSPRARGGTTSWNTVIITVVSVSIELVLGMAIALVMHRAIFGRGPVRAAILIPYGIVTVVAAFAWKYAFDPTSGFVAGLPLISDTAQPLNTRSGSLLVIILAEVWKTTPFMALLLLAGLALVPDELHEAAKVDGASTVQRFFRITIPLMKPAILVALLFRTLDAFRIFDNIYIIQPGGALNTESVSILGYNVTINRVNVGLGSAISILIFLCVILIAIFFVKALGTSTAQQRGEA